MDSAELAKLDAALLLLEQIESTKNLSLDDIASVVALLQTDYYTQWKEFEWVNLNSNLNFEIIDFIFIPANEPNLLVTQNVLAICKYLVSPCISLDILFYLYSRKAFKNGDLYNTPKGQSKKFEGGKICCPITTFIYWFNAGSHLFKGLWWPGNLENPTRC